MSKEPHTFKADPNVCSRYHGPDMTAARVQNGARTLIHELETTIEARIMASRSRIHTVRVWSPTVYAYVDTVTVDPTTITGVELVEVAGQQGVTLHLSTGRRISTQIGELLGGA